MKDEEKNETGRLKGKCRRMKQEGRRMSDNDDLIILNAFLPMAKY